MSNLVPQLKQLAQWAEWVEDVFYPPIAEPLHRANLVKYSIPDLSELLDGMIEADTHTLQLVIDSVRCQIAFLYAMGRAISKVRGGKMDHLEANRVIKNCEESFLEKLKALGLKVDYKSEISAEELVKNPCLILATHQGGGGENYLAQAITGLECGIVVKDALMTLPFVKDGLNGKKAIAVDRNLVNDLQTRAQEINRVAAAIVERLSAGENMMVFFEGTSSADGEIASTPQRKKWAKELLAAIDQAWQQRKENEVWRPYGASASANKAAVRPDGKEVWPAERRPIAKEVGPAERRPIAKEFQKLLLVFNTMAVMPDAPEEKLFGTRFRLNTTLGARLVRADNLLVEEAEDVYDDPATLFGKARLILKELLIDTIMEQQDRLRLDAV